jgi:hypothetical protein
LLSKNAKIKILKTVILYGSETWSFTLRGCGCLRTGCCGEYLDVRGIGNWRKLHNEALHSLYPSPNIITVIKSRRMRWGENVARTEAKKIAYSVLIRKPVGNRPLLRDRSR